MILVPRGTFRDRTPAERLTNGAHGHLRRCPMKAIQAASRGGYDALRLVHIPQPQSRAGQALVRVTSAGVTPLDRTVLAGLSRSGMVPVACTYMSDPPIFSGAAERPDDDRIIHVMIMSQRFADVGKLC